MKYPKILTLWERDPATKYRTLIRDRWATPEFYYLRNLDWVYTEKIDGTNIRVAWTQDPILQSFSPGFLTFTGRTDKAQIPPFLLKQLEVDFTPELMESVFPDTEVILYGEGYGNKIQAVGSQYDPDGVNFILFDVRINGVWLERESVEDIAAKLQIDVVPVVGVGSLRSAIERAEYGFSSNINPNVQAEGIVVRPALELSSRMGNRIIGKIKYKDFPRR